MNRFTTSPQPFTAWIQPANFSTESGCSLHALVREAEGDVVGRPLVLEQQPHVGRGARGVDEVPRAPAEHSGQAEEAQLISWIDADPARAAKYRPALARIEALDAERRKTREADEAWKDLLAQSKLPAQAVSIVRMAEERGKPDTERDLDYQQRNWSRLEQSSRALRRSYAREIDRAVMKLYLMRAIALAD